MNGLEILLEAKVGVSLQFGVKMETGENVRTILLFYLNWGILENRGHKYVRNIILALWLKFDENWS